MRKKFKCQVVQELKWESLFNAMTSLMEQMVGILADNYDYR